MYGSVQFNVERRFTCFLASLARLEIFKLLKMTFISLNPQNFLGVVKSCTSDLSLSALITILDIGRSDNIKKQTVKVFTPINFIVYDIKTEQFTHYIQARRVSLGGRGRRRERYSNCEHFILTLAKIFAPLPRSLWWCDSYDVDGY